MIICTVSFNSNGVGRLGAGGAGGYLHILMEV